MENEYDSSSTFVWVRDQVDDEELFYDSKGEIVKALDLDWNTYVDSFKLWQEESVCWKNSLLKIALQKHYISIGKPTWNPIVVPKPPFVIESFHWYLQLLFLQNSFHFPKLSTKNPHFLT